MKIFNDFLYKELKNENVPYREFITLIADKKCFNATMQLSRFYVEECAKLQFINIFDIINEQLAKQAAIFFRTEMIKNENIEYFVIKRDIPAAINTHKDTFGVLHYQISIIYNEYYKV